MTNNDFLIIKLNQKNEFRTVASFELNGLCFSAVDVKIDTGCPHTSFPILKLGISEESAYRLKEKDCRNESIQKTISFGVNDTKVKRDEDKRKFRNKRFMELNSISFKHKEEKSLHYNQRRWNISNAFFVFRVPLKLLFSQPLDTERRLLLENERTLMAEQWRLPYLLT